MISKTIKEICNKENGITLIEIYRLLPNEKKHSIRGTINYLVKEGKLIRLSKGKYKLN